MSLIFKCDNCETEYPAKRVLAGMKVEDVIIEDESSPCPACIREIEVAREAALSKRKKKK